ncbi:MAG: ABC transporter permease, partial [Ardenticatenaceae bacterium]|nr:ABC transporter permease [Ardenticatenaceae bacterium]
FLGFGIQPPTPEWGAMLSEGRPYLQEAPWMSTFSGLSILVTVVGFNLLGEGVRDVLDPQQGASV